MGWREMVQQNAQVNRQRPETPFNEAFRTLIADVMQRGQEMRAEVRGKEGDKLKRQQMVVGAGYQPQDIDEFLATGQGGKWTAPEYGLSADEGGEFPQTKGGLQLNQIQFVKLGNRLVAKPTYGQAFELTSDAFQNMIVAPEDYGMNKGDITKLKDWMREQVMGQIGSGQQSQEDLQSLIKEYNTIDGSNTTRLRELEELLTQQGVKFE